MLSSYSSIYNLGHRAIKDLLNGPVNVEEKIDGSQFSFGIDMNNQLFCRSHHSNINIDCPNGMFKEAVEVVKTLYTQLRPGWTYRGEYLRKNKHNCLTYNNIPDKHIIIFDIDKGLENYLSYEEKCIEAQHLGLLVAPLIYTGMIKDESFLISILDRESFLGGTKIEGVVIKPVNYDLFGVDKKVLMGKYVSEVFKEINRSNWRQDNPNTGDIIASIGALFKTEARWKKALQHLTEAGCIRGDLKDIGLLIKEVPEDILREAEQEIKDKLFKYAWPKIRRMITSGIPDWYKALLLGKQFEEVQNE